MFSCHPIFQVVHGKIFVNSIYAFVHTSERELKLWNWRLTKSTISATWRNYLMMMVEKVLSFFYKKSFLFYEKKNCKLFCKWKTMKKMTEEITEVKSSIYIYIYIVVCKIHKWEVRSTKSKLLIILFLGLTQSSSPYLSAFVYCLVWTLYLHLLLDGMVVL